MTTPVNGSIFNSNLPSFFDKFSSAAAQDLMTLQLVAGQLEPSGGIVTVTNPIIPDRTVAQRMNNFDPTIYDLRDQSTLMKIMKVLLGGAGAGGLRKQSAIARLQNTFSGMHFLDLDRFYGALFGISRTAQEGAPDIDFDPYHDATDPASWDDLQARDASYRDRLIKFAKSIYFGGSVAGITAMAESLIGAQVDVYESWEWVDEENADVLVNSTLIYTYTFLNRSVGTWAGLTGHTWADWGGGTLPFVGRTGQRNRSEFILQPHIALTIDERYEILRVINTFKPAGTQFTINPAGLTTQTPISLRAVAADSEYWAIIPVTVPNPQLGTNVYIPSGDITVRSVIQQRPAFSQFQGDDWSYNNDILGVTSYTIDNGVTSTTTDDQTVVYSDSTTRTYVAAAAPMTGAQAISARIVSDGVLTATPYAPTRGSINTALVTT
jgi:hypothetical protein